MLFRGSYCNALPVHLLSYGLCSVPRITYQRWQSCTFYVWEGVRRNTRRVKPTPEEEYVATQDAWHQRRRRRSTSQHKTCDTNAGGGVCCNTRRVTPTPEEKEYVAIQDAGGGGVRRNTRRRRRRSTSQYKTPEEEEYVAIQDAGGGGVCRNTRRVTPTPEEEEYVATQDVWHQRRRRSMLSPQ